MLQVYIFLHIPRNHKRSL